MDKFKSFLIASILFTTLVAAPVSATSDDGLHRLTTPVGGIAFEVVGQVTNFPPAGHLSAIRLSKPNQWLDR